MKIVLVHGFNVRDGGANSLDKLAPYLQAAGHEVEVDRADYGFFSLWAVRFRKHSAVRRIAGALETADAVVSHSNGANYTNKALNALHNSRWLREVRIAPALNRGTAAAPNVRRCTVLHTRTDVWVWLSGFLVGHAWGWQGLLGYKGPDTRMVNWDYSDLVRDHSGYFDDDIVERVARDVLAALEAS